MHFTRPGESINSYIKSKPFPNLPEYRTAYFLFFRFRIATTSDANVSKIMNSSYVLIKYHTFLQTRERVGARPSASRVSILLSMCRSSCRTIQFWLVLWFSSNEYRRNCASVKTKILVSDRGGVSLIGGCRV